MIKVKANQPKLYGAIVQHTQGSVPQRTYQSQERNRGRTTHRRVQVFTPPPDVDPGWQGVGCVVQVARFGTRGSKPYATISYYISSLSPDAKKLVPAIRGHWSIENRLHWVKDVIYKEDSSPQTAGHAPLNLSVLKTWVLTLCRALGYESITEAVDSNRHNLTYLRSICT